MGQGYIPLTEIECYCRLFEIELEDRDFLLRLVRAIDMRYIELTRAKESTKTRP
jgi:hypothetical protein